MKPRVSTVTVGRNKDAPRVWLEGRYLVDAGFAPAQRVAIDFEPGRVTVKLSPQGSRVVSAKRAGAVSVLDINCAALVKAFGAVTRLQVYVTAGLITITAAETERLRATRCRNGKEGSLYAGGGLLTEAARLAGYEPAFAVEVDPDYAAIYERNHPQALMFNTSIEDVPLDHLPAVELLTMGIPCEPYSRSRTRDRVTGALRDKSLPPEAHALSDLSLWAALIIRKLNPATVVIEEAPGYLASATGFIMRHFLQRAGYTVEAQVMDPREYGELTGRKRTVIVAHSNASFAWPTPAPCAYTFGAVRDDESALADHYFTAEQKPWLVNHWRNQDNKGNGFTPPQLTDASAVVPVIKKRYFAQQGDGVVVQHPQRANCWRWLTIREVRRLHGVPDSYELFEAQSKTRAGEVLGQGVIVSFFRRVIAAINQPAPAPVGQLAFSL